MHWQTHQTSWKYPCALFFNQIYRFNGETHLFSCVIILSSFFMTHTRTHNTLKRHDKTRRMHSHNNQKAHRNRGCICVCVWVYLSFAMHAIFNVIDTLLFLSIPLSLCLCLCVNACVWVWREGPFSYCVRLFIVYEVVFFAVQLWLIVVLLLFCFFRFYDNILLVLFSCFYSPLPLLLPLSMQPSPSLFCNYILDFFYVQMFVMMLYKSVFDLVLLLLFFLIFEMQRVNWHTNNYYTHIKTKRAWVSAVTQNPTNPSHCVHTQCKHSEAKKQNKSN